MIISIYVEGFVEDNKQIARDMIIVSTEQLIQISNEYFNMVGGFLVGSSGIKIYIIHNQNK